jgi:hypothetical protein
MVRVWLWENRGLASAADAGLWVRLAASQAAAGRAAARAVGARWGPRAATRAALGDDGRCGVRECGDLLCVGEKLESLGPRGAPGRAAAGAGARRPPAACEWACGILCGIVRGAASVAS